MQLERTLRSFGWSLDEDGIDIMYRSPVDIYIDQWFAELTERIDASGVRRVLIDSIDDLRFTTADEIRFREYMYSLVQRCARRQISLLMTLEIPDITRVEKVSDFAVSHLSDNVVLLQYIWKGGRVTRSLTMLKARSSDVETRLREFRITSDGVVLGDDVEPGQDFGKS